MDTTERLHFHFSLSCTGGGNGNPLQCSCLENLRDGGAWWAAIYGVTQSRTRLKWLSSSSIQLSVWYWMLLPFTKKVWNSGEALLFGGLNGTMTIVIVGMPICGKNGYIGKIDDYFSCLKTIVKRKWDFT